MDGGTEGGERWRESETEREEEEEIEMKRDKERGQRERAKGRRQRERAREKESCVGHELNRILTDAVTLRSDQRKDLHRERCGRGRRHVRLHPPSTRAGGEFLNWELCRSVQFSI